MATLGNTTATSLEVLGNAKAATFTGNLTGNVTGNVTGNASTATTATSATKIQNTDVTFKDLVITKSDGTTTTYKLVCKS